MPHPATSPTNTDQPVNTALPKLSRPARIVVLAVAVIVVAGVAYVADMSFDWDAPTLELVAGSDADWTTRSEYQPTFARFAGHDPAGRYLTLAQRSQSGHHLTILFDTKHDVPLLLRADDTEMETRRDTVRADTWVADGLFVEMWSYDRIEDVPPLLRGLMQTMSRRSRIVSRHWKFNSEEQTLVITNDVSRGSDCANISPDGRQRALIDDAWKTWFADSRRQFRITGNSLAVVDNETGETLWHKSHDDLEAEVFGDLGKAPNPPPFSADVINPGIMVIETIRREQTTALRTLVIKKDAAAPDGHTFEQWELIVPGYEWVQLGQGRNFFFDLSGTFGISFAEKDDGCRIERFDTATRTRALLYEGDAPSPAPSPNIAGLQLADSVCIVPDPDRVYWLAADKTLWLLPLETAPVPTRVWPREGREHASVAEN